MEKAFNKFTDEIIQELKRKKPTKEYESLNLNFNPFPAAGLPRLVDSLPPLDKSETEKIMNFIRSTYMSPKRQDYAGLTVVGEYGMGKTHLMKYIKDIIEKLSSMTVEERKDLRFSAVTCFIDKPDDSPQLVIHKIIEQIGLDNIRKYIGKILLDEFKKDKVSFHNKFQSSQATLFDNKPDWDKLFEEPAISNFLEFISRFKKVRGDIASLQEAARQIINKKVVQDTTLADRYLDLVFEEKKANASWDVLAGYIMNRNMQRKEVMFLNSIVDILHHVGFHQLYVFVDEFEDVSKLNRTKLSNYLITLNTLINRQARWAMVVSLTKDALGKIKEESVPLHDRLTTYSLRLNPLTDIKAKQMITNYLNMAREKEQNSHAPFSDEAIKEMLKTTRGNYRSFILLAHKAVNIAAQQNKNAIDANIISSAKGLSDGEEYSHNS